QARAAADGVEGSCYFICFANSRCKRVLRRGGERLVNWKSSYVIHWHTLNQNHSLLRAIWRPIGAEVPMSIRAKAPVRSEEDRQQCELVQLPPPLDIAGQSFFHALPWIGFAAN